MHTEGFAGARDVTAQRADRARELAESLLSRGVRMVALSQVDNAGVTRVKAVPVAWLGHAAGWGVGMSPVFDVFLVRPALEGGRVRRLQTPSTPAGGLLPPLLGPGANGG